MNFQFSFLGMRTKGAPVAGVGFSFFFLNYFLLLFFTEY